MKDREERATEICVQRDRERGWETENVTLTDRLTEKELHRGKETNSTNLTCAWCPTLL